MDILSQTVQQYIDTFSGFIDQFFIWGTWIFGSLLAINFGWLCLWYAIDKESISKSMPAFLRQFFIILLFYTLMLHPDWLFDILKTSRTMGDALAGVSVDPSSLITDGIMIGNKILQAVANTSLLSDAMGVLFIGLVYIAVVGTFIYIAIEIALTLIVTTALICVSALFLSFAALGVTTQIARNILDVILGNCVKLLGIYIVIAAGSKTITALAAAVPNSIHSFDAYWWLLAAVFLFFGLTKALPSQLAKVITLAVQESHAAEAAAIALSSARYAKSSLSSVVPAAAAGAAGLAKIAGSTMYNAASHAKANLSSGVGTAAKAAVVGTARDAVKAGGGAVADHFKNLSSKLAGGSATTGGSSHGNKKIPSFAERMYQSAKDANSTQSVPRKRQ